MSKNYINRRNAEYDPIGDPLGGDPRFSHIRKFADPITAAAGISGGASLLGSVVSGNAAKSAAQTQADAAQAAAEMQMQAGQAQIPNIQNINTQQQGVLSNIYGNQQANLAPYQSLGAAGATQLQNMIPDLSRSFTSADLNSYLAPNYQWQLQQGLGATNQAMNVAGGGSNMVNAADIFAQNYAGNAYQNAFNNFQTQQNNIYNRLAGIAGIGTNANTQNIASGGQYGTSSTNLAQSTGNTIANLALGVANAGAGGITGAANAQAAGQVGQANALSNGLSSAGNTYLLSQLLAPKTSATGATGGETAMWAMPS